MPQDLQQSRLAAARAARAYFDDDLIGRTTRAHPERRSLADMAVLHHAKLPLTKKYYSLLKKGLKLPIDKDCDGRKGSKAQSEAGPRASRGGRPPALTDAEERALIEYINNVENSCFAVTEACIRNYASFLRKHRIQGPTTAISVAWVRRFKKRHPELQCKVPTVKQISRAGAELQIPELERWFRSYSETVTKEGIKAQNNWNFDKTPL